MIHEDNVQGTNQTNVVQALELIRSNLQIYLCLEQSSQYTKEVLEGLGSPHSNLAQYSRN